MIDTLRAIACEVRKAVSKMKDSKGKELRMGADGTPTSAIDSVAEETVLKYIKSHKVKFNVLSEEAGLIDNGYKETLVLDPIDGTTNSVSGIPMYTISMAVGKDSLLGIHTAYLMNLVTGDEYTAEKGKGAYLNGKRIKAQKDFDPGKATMSVYLGRGTSKESYDLINRIKSTRYYGCSSLDMAIVAQGVHAGYLMHTEIYDRSIRIVDIAASTLILKEAGGEVYDMEGEVLDMPFDVTYRSNFLAVANRKVFDYVMEGFMSRGPQKGKMRYGIYVNTKLDNAVDVTKRVLKLMKGEDVVLDTKIADAIGKKGCPISKMDVDTIITIGGDGTILRAMHNADVPIVGINAGGVGFLTEIPLENLDEGIERLLKGEYTVKSRPKIKVIYNGETLGEAVNEAVIHSDSVAKIRRFKIYVNDQLTSEIRADGIVLSTPVGSTSYARSLGGPIMDHRVDAWLMVPMAAFEAPFKQMILPTSVKVTIEAVLNKGCLVVIDGQKEVNIPGGSKIALVKSQRNASFISFGTDFYSRVRDKLVKSI